MATWHVLAQDQAVWERWPADAAVKVVHDQCVPLGPPHAPEVVQTQERLKHRLALVLDPRLSPELRRRVALYLNAETLEARARERAEQVSRTRADIESGRLDRAASALYDLERLVLFTAQLRNQRAELTRIRITGDGTIQLTLKPPSPSPPLSTLVARAVANLIDEAARTGLDCTSTDLYAGAVAAAGDRTTLPLSLIRQDDLRRLHARVETLHQACIDRISRGATYFADTRTPTPAELMAVVEEVGRFLDKASRVLGQAIEQYEDDLDARLDGRLRAPTAEPPADTPEPSIPPGTTATLAPAGGPTPTPPPEKSRGEIERDAFVQDMHRQVEMLRRQQGGEVGGLATRPTSSANNLHIRMKRLHRIAATAAGVGRTDGTFTCPLADGVVHVTFEQKGGELRRLKAEVTERFPDQVSLTWWVSIERRSDADFKLQSQLGGIGAYMDVEKGEPVRFPNYQQIIILVNRLDQILQGARVPTGPVAGPRE